MAAAAATGGTGVGRSSMSAALTDLLDGRRIPTEPRRGDQAVPNADLIHLIAQLILGKYRSRYVS